MNDDRIDGF